MHRITCSEIWGGNKEINTDVCTGSVTASLFSCAADGGKGGDIYYFSVCGHDNVTRIAVADVTGHDEIVEDVGRWLYRSMASCMNEMAGNSILGDLNWLAMQKGHRAITTAEVITVVKTQSRLYFSYAGHPPLLIKRHDETVWRRVAILRPTRLQNIPLGVLEDAAYDEENIPLQSGDILFLYTDGVVEAPGGADGLFGGRRLLQVLEQITETHPNRLKHGVLDALSKFSGQPFAHDDVTMMAIRVN